MVALLPSSELAAIKNSAVLEVLARQNADKTVELRRTPTLGDAWRLTSYVSLTLRGAPCHADVSMRKFIVQAWNFIFNHDVSPLRHIPDVAIRHYVFQALGLMWAVSFALAIGSYTFLAASLVGHAVLIAAAAITVATYTVAATKPMLIVSGLGRRRDGEHE